MRWRRFITQHVSKVFYWLYSYDLWLLFSCFFFTRVIDDYTFHSEHSQHRDMDVRNQDLTITLFRYSCVILLSFNIYKWPSEEASGRQAYESKWYLLVYCVFAAGYCGDFLRARKLFYNNIHLYWEASAEIDRLSRNQHFQH